MSILIESFLRNHKNPEWNSKRSVMPSLSLSIPSLFFFSFETGSHIFAALLAKKLTRVIVSVVVNRKSDKPRRHSRHGLLHFTLGHNRESDSSRTEVDCPQRSFSFSFIHTFGPFSTTCDVFYYVAYYMD